MAKRVYTEFDSAWKDHNAVDIDQTVNVRNGDGKLPPFLHNAMGVDFSGGQRPERKIWLAEVKPIKEGRRLSVIRIANNFTYEALVNEIAAFRGSGVLVDFPFGLAQASVNNLMANQAGIPANMWQAVADTGTPDAFRIAAKGGVVGPDSEIQHKRKIDCQCHTPFAPVNLRLASQTFYGMSDILLPLSRRGTVIFPWSQAVPDSKWVAEGCPSSTLRSWGIDPRGYKGPAANHQAGRGDILKALVRSGLELDAPTNNVIVADREGDALDAVVLAIAASRVGPPSIERGLEWVATHQTEGFIYT